MILEKFQYFPIFPEISGSFRKFPSDFKFPEIFQPYDCIWLRTAWTLLYPLKMENTAEFCKYCSVPLHHDASDRFKSDRQWFNKKQPTSSSSSSARVHYTRTQRIELKFSPIYLTLKLELPSRSEFANSEFDDSANSEQSIFIKSDFHKNDFHKNNSEK